jgi:hypothetical protein
MPSKNYGWHKLWTLDMPGLTATHETGLAVRYIKTDAAVIVQTINAVAIAAALEPKHGHNAGAMIHRLKREAAMLWDFAIARQARVDAAIAREARKAARAAERGEVPHG